MIGAALALGLLGALLSAVFSGSETGMYRVARLRLEVAARGGDWVAAALGWLVDRPSIFVPMVLVGNNFANYLVSLALVLSIQITAGRSNHWVELAATILMAPVVFVLCELLPKRLFLRAPYRLLRGLGVPFLALGVLLAPISAVLWLANLGLAAILGGVLDGVRPALARRELAHVLDEGHEAGLLYTTQRRLARNLFRYAAVPVTDYLSQLPPLPEVSLDAPASEALEAASQRESRFVAVRGAESRTVGGYVDVLELIARPDAPLRESLRPLPRIRADEDFLDALVRLYDQGRPVAQVIDQRGVTVGLVQLESLRRLLLAKEGDLELEDEQEDDDE